MPKRQYRLSSPAELLRKWAPWTLMVAPPLLIPSEGEREESSYYAVLRRRSAVLVTRSANCEQRRRL